MSTEAPFTLRAVSLSQDAPDELVETLSGKKFSRESLSLKYFENLIGTTIMVVGINASTPFEVLQVTEKPKSMCPGKNRMPFSVLVRGAENITFDGCHFDLLHPQLGLIPYVMLSRTMVFPDQPPGVYCEIMFN